LSGSSLWLNSTGVVSTENLTAFVVDHDKPDGRRRPLDMIRQAYRFMHVCGVNSGLFQDLRLSNGPSAHQLNAIKFRPNLCRNPADPFV
jgi:hypothetical protein